jgi:hypothetical protein
MYSIPSLERYFVLELVVRVLWVERVWTVLQS